MAALIIAGLFDGQLGTGIAWFITISLLVAGLVGCVLPFLPGHLLILLAAVAHRLMLGDASGLTWWSFLILGLLMVLSQTLEFLSGAAGARWFGGSRWGAVGALVGALGGLLFFPVGLLAGPLIGALVCELAFAKQETKEAIRSGLGSVVGTLTGMLINTVLGLTMTLWVIIDALWIH